MNKTIVVGEADRSTHRGTTERVSTKAGSAEDGAEGGTGVNIARIVPERERDTTRGMARIVTGKDETGAAGS